MRHKIQNCIRTPTQTSIRLPSQITQQITTNLPVQQSTVAVAVSPEESPNREERSNIEDEWLNIQDECLLIEGDHSNIQQRTQANTNEAPMPREDPLSSTSAIDDLKSKSNNEVSTRGQQEQLYSSLDEQTTVLQSVAPIPRPQIRTDVPIPPMAIDVNLIMMNIIEKLARVPTKVREKTWEYFEKVAAGLENNTIAVEDFPDLIRRPPPATSQSSISRERRQPQSEPHSFDLTFDTYQSTTDVASTPTIPLTNTRQKETLTSFRPSMLRNHSNTEQPRIRVASYQSSQQTATTTSFRSSSLGTSPKRLLTINNVNRYYDDEEQPTERKRRAPPPRTRVNNVLSRIEDMVAPMERYIQRHIAPSTCYKEDDEENLW
ncbi:unnamed protein product [Didymodactylos carnosus]|uniref:Uncharacterized protein n=1 Tax=Didymodactylos carnosus TaxID=1234261 RepID=A0A815VKI0_9BILA|nr:unnamed protein product [Didymodactylos carnosus]CAF4389231.1 unnamed protein product [Didymodactylos carnosus]